MNASHPPGPTGRANPEVPCLLPGLAREFAEHVDYLSRSIHACGIDHARGVARDLAGLCHNPERLMEHAVAKARGEAR
jgi:hypothetical protein